MDLFTFSMISLGVATNLICFLFGSLYGRHTAYETIKPAEVKACKAKRCNKAACDPKSGKIS